MKLYYSAVFRGARKFLSLLFYAPEALKLLVLKWMRPRPLISIYALGAVKVSHRSFPGMPGANQELSSVITDDISHHWFSHHLGRPKGAITINGNINIIEASL